MYYGHHLFLFLLFSLFPDLLQLPQQLSSVIFITAEKQYVRYTLGNPSNSVPHKREGSEIRDCISSRLLREDYRLHMKPDRYRVHSTRTQRE